MTFVQAPAVVPKAPSNNVTRRPCQIYLFNFRNEFLLLLKIKYVYHLVHDPGSRENERNVSNHENQTGPIDSRTLDAIISVRDGING